MTVLLLVLAALAAPWNDPATLKPFPGPDVAPSVRLREMNAQFLTWTGIGQELLALDQEGFAVRDVSGAKRVEKACPGRKEGTSVDDAAASRDGSTLAVLLDDGHVCVWAGGLPPLPLGRKDWTEIELLDAGTLAVGRDDGTVEVREVSTGKVRWRRNVGVGAINGLRQSADGSRIYASGDRRGGAVFYAANGRLIHTVGKEPSYAIVADPSTNSILLGRGDGRVERWDMRTWRRTDSFDLGDGPVRDLDLAAVDQLVIAAVQEPGGARWRGWSLETRDFVFDEPVNGSGKLRFRFVPGSRALVTNAGELRSAIWRRPSPPSIPYPGHNVEPPRERELFPEMSGGEIAAYAGDPTGLADASLDPAGQRAVGRTADGRWAIGGVGRAAVPLAGSDGLTGPVVWSPDGQRFAAWVAAGELRLWTAEGVLERRFVMERPRSVAVDGARVLVAGADGLVRVSAEKGLRVVKGVEGATAVALAPTRGDRFGYGTATGEVRVGTLSGAETRRATSIFVNPVSAVAFSPDGRRFAASAARAGGFGASVVILDEQTGEAAVEAGGGYEVGRQSFRADDVPTRLRFLSPSRVLVEEPRAVRVLDLKLPAEVFVTPGEIASAAVSGLSVLVADPEGRVRRLPLGNTPLATVPVGSPLGISGNGRFAAVADGDTVTLWSAVTGLRRIELVPAGAPVRAGVFSRTAKRFAALTTDGEVEVYDTDVGEIIGHTPGPVGSDWLRFSPDETWVWTTENEDLVAWAVADGAEQVRVDLPAGASVDTLRSAGRFVTLVLPDGKRRWVDTAADAKRREFGEEEGERPLAVNTTGKVVAVASADGVERRDLGTGLKIGKTLRWDESVAGDAAGFTPDGNFLAVADTNNVIRVLDLVTGRLFRSMGADAPPVGRTDVDAVVGLAFNDSGSLLATFDAAGRHRTWQWGNGFDRGYELELRGDIRAVGGTVGFLSSADGSILYVGYEDGTVRGWDTRTGELATLLRAHVAPVTSMVLSEDGTRLATGGADGVVRVYELAEEREIGGYTTVGDPIAAVHLDGETVWAVTDAGVVRRWDTTNHKRLGRWTGATLPAPPPAFEPGLDTSAWSAVLAGTRHLGRVYTAHADDRIRIWDPATGTLVGVLVALSDGSFVLDRADGRRIASPSLRDGTSPVLFGSIWEGVAP